MVPIFGIILAQKNCQYQYFNCQKTPSYMMPGTVIWAHNCSSTAVIATLEETLGVSV